MPSDSVRSFYDDLAATYDLIYPDWTASSRRQGRALDRAIGQQLGVGPATILDCAAGIGTQALGLAELGHRVTASDLSPVALRRARGEAAHRGVQLDFLVADMRRLPFPCNTFDAVVCADNSLPHLLTDGDVHTALTAMASVTRPGGLLLLSTRDYDRIRQHRPRSASPSVAQTADGRVITFQLWNWHADGERYDLEHVQLVERDGHLVGTSRTTTYWAIPRHVIEGHLLETGWQLPRWLEPETSGYFQPLVLAERTRQSGVYSS